MLCGGLPRGAMDELVTRMNKPQEVKVFLSWCDARGGIGLCPFLWWWLSPIYSRLGPLPKYEWEGIPQRQDLKGDK